MGQSLLTIVAVLLFLLSLLFFGGSKSAIHEIYSALFLLMALICIVGAWLGNLLKTLIVAVGREAAQNAKKDL